MSEDGAPPAADDDDGKVVPLRRAGRGEASPPIDFSSAAAEPLLLARQERNDLGNARRYAARAVDKLVHVDRWGWTGYVGTHWSVEDGAHLAGAHALDTVAAMWGEAGALDARAATLKAAGKEADAKRHKGDAGALRKWAGDSGMAARLAAMREIAQTLLRAHPDDFDADRDVINVANGTLRARVEGGDVVTITRADHDPRARITRLAGTAYDPAAPCPEWERHLGMVLPHADDRAFFQAAIGYALTGYTREQCIFLLHGKGGDGKSTTMNVIRRIMGSYAQAADVKTFLTGPQRSGDDATPSLARLAGDVRLVSCGEPPRGATLNEGLVKLISGGSPVLARELHGAPFEYTPRYKLFIEFNPRPRIPGDDDGIWRRIKVLPFPTQIFKSGQADKSYEERLMGEAAGIFNWMLAGLDLYLREGLVDSINVREATEDYRRGANPFGDWWVERVIEDETVKTPAAELYGDYKDWCERQGVEAISNTAFGRALGDRQVIKAGRNAKGNVLRRGAKLREPGDDGGMLAAQAFADGRDRAPEF